MGRPEPCVLFAQSFVHPHLDEYVDEVRFTEPVVISACEFLEQNASASCPMISLSGASFPQSFALEAFVQCEGDARFRRLCQAFLYSPSSSNILEVQPVVTNHLVIRGSYRSLTLVVYGNTAEELGQFSVEFDLDNSLANLVRSHAEGKIEDLPLALQSVKPTFEESISSVKRLHLNVKPQPLIEVKEILYLGIKILQTCVDETIAQTLTGSLLLAVSPYLLHEFSAVAGNDKHNDIMKYSVKSPQQFSTNLVKVKIELMDLYRKLGSKTNDMQSGISEYFELDDHMQPVAEDLVLDIFQQCFQFDKDLVSDGISINSQISKLVAGLSMVHLLCTDTEGCCQFVKAGGMQHLINVLQHDLGRSTSTTLLALGVVEHACRYAVGCEAFLGWVRRKGESVPTGTSEGYGTLLKLLLQRPRHNVACLVTKILHRLRAYEIMVKFESTVGSLLENLSANSKVSESGIKALVEANSEIKRLLKLLNLREPTEDPSPVAHAKRLLLDQDDDVLPYKTTVGLIGSSKYCVAQRDIDSYLLSLLKERCFLPLLAALLSSPSLRSGTGYTLDIFVDLVTTIEAILLSLLLCRSGLLFFVSEPEATAALVVALQGVEDINREEFLSLRYAAVMISKGFFCPPQDIGMIVETNLRVVSAIDRLIGAALHSEELLWALWDLCSISRSDIGRQAVLAIGFFPEAISVLMTVLQSGKESESLNANSGTSPLSLAIFHASAELFEVMVNDSTACSMNAWIPHAVDLHKALHSSSPGSNKKDAPTRLLERVDAAVVYHKKGAIGLLRYAAVLASGGDAQLTSTSFLISDPMEIENIAAADSGGSADFQSVESILGKLVTDKLFDGVILRDSSVPPLTTAMRILSFLAEHPGIAAVLYEEGAVTVVYVIIRNCAMMLERSSNTYDYLVDEGAECNSTADLLLERSQEQYLIDMLFPSLILLLTVLRKLQEAAEQHHNTKLLNALLQLHREISPKLAARTAVLPFCFASSTLGLGGVCHLLVSCVACWPIFGWTPGLFQRLLENAPAPASLALGPKEACSVLYLLGELFPEEGIWLWKNGTSSLNALKTLGVGTLLGIKSIEDIDWYLQPHQFEKMLSRLLPHLDKISQIVLHFACAALVVLQDTLRVLVIRISCQKPDSGAVLLRPLLCWVQDHIINGVTISETDAFKGERLLEFLAGLLEHPFTKKILMSEGLVDILISALDKIIELSVIGEKLSMENRVSVNEESSLWMQWCFPLFRSFSFICDPGVSVYPTTVISRRLSDCPSFEGHCAIISRLLKFCIVSKVGKELRACWDALTSLSSHNLGRSAFAFVSIQMRPSVLGRDTSKESEYVFGTTSSEEPNHVASCPLLSCWQKLLAAMENDDHISHEAIEIVRCFAIGILHLCAAGKSSHGLVASRSLFGLECESAESQNEENLKLVLHMIDLLNMKISGAGAEVCSHTLTKLEQTRAAVRSMHCLLEKSMSIVHVPEVVPEIELPSSDLSFSSWELPPHSAIKSEVLLKCISKGSQTSNEDLEELQKGIQRTDESYFLGRLADKFMWECPDSSPDLPTIPVPSLKRKAASVDGSNRRQRGDGVGSVGGAEATAASSFVRAGGTSVSSSGPSRRDAFRQRKPNTSRPPSMHVDDYVARERNNDGMSSSSNVATVSRAGSTGGRPPSIHVDEFMARQRERQQLVASSSGDLQQPVHAPLPETESIIDNKVSKSRQMKTHLEDDLQEINIELDVVSESDDMLQFPQSDDFLPSAPGGLPGTNSSDSLADDAEFNTGTAPHFIQSTKDTPSNPGEGLNPASGISREPVTQSEGGIQRHGSLTGDKGQINQIVSGETQFHQDQYNNRMQNTRPISSKGYETLSMSKPPETMMQFYDQRSVSGVIQTVAEQGSMSFPALHHGSNQSQPGPGPTLTVSQSHFEQKALAHAPPLPPLPPPPAIPSGSTPQRVETSNLHMSSYMHSARDVQPPLPSGLPFQAYDSAMSGPVSSLPGRDQNYTAPKDYYKDGGGSSMNATTAPPLPPTGSHAQLEVPLHQPPPLQFHPEQMRPAGYGSIALSTPPRPLFDSVSGVSTSTTPWVGVPSTARISDENISSSRPPPPLPPMPPPFSAPPVLQASVQGSSVPPVSGMYIQSIPAAPLPPSGSSSDKPFGSFSASSIGQSSVTQSHPLPPAFVPPLPPGRPMSLSGNLSSGVLAQHQGQNQQTQTHHGQQPLQPQPPLQPRQPPQPPQPPRPPPPQPPQQPRPPLQPHQTLEQRPQTHTQGSMHPPHLQYQPQPPSPQQNQPQQTLQQHPHLHQQQTQQTYYSQQPQESLQQQQHDQGEHLLPQYHHQQAEHAQHQNLQQQESSLRLQQYFSSPESIQALLSDQEKLRQLLEQHPKLMQMLQERL